MNAARRALRIARVLLQFRLYALLRLLELPWWGRALYAPFQLAEAIHPAISLRADGVPAAVRIDTAG